MNNCSFIATLGRDAEIRYTSSQKPITQFSIAVNSGFGDHQVTTWINCNFFGTRGEKVAQYLLKGTTIGVIGEIANRKYQDKQGNDKWSLELNVSNVTLLGQKSKDDTTTRPSQNNRSQRDASDFSDINDDKPWPDDDQVPF
jgi:single-strand DNA-binding protein